MKKYGFVFLVFFLLLLSAALPFGSGSGSLMDRLSTALEIVATIAAAGGLLGLLIQFSRERNLSEADFVLRLNQDFITNESIFGIYRKLELSRQEGQKKNPFVEEDVIDLANYISYFEPFMGLLERRVVTIPMIDILAYRFFLATNNRFVQELLLCNGEKTKAWYASIRLHRAWREYRLREGLPVWQEEYDLLKAVEKLPPELQTV